MRIIDFHTHPGWNTTKDFGYDMTNERYISMLKKAGITMSCGSLIDYPYFRLEVSEYETLIPELNRKVWVLQEQYPDFYIPGIHIHPNFVEMSLEQLRLHKARGGKLVGELVGYLMQYDSFITAEYMGLFETCRDLGMVLSLHQLSVAEAEVIAAAFPTMPVVMAHPDYKTKYYEKLEALGKYHNLYLDLSGAGTNITGMLRYGVDNVGAEHFLFGTDFPAYNPAMYVHSVLYEELTDRQREMILWRNAAGILQLAD